MTSIDHVVVLNESLGERGEHTKIDAKHKYQLSCLIMFDLFGDFYYERNESTMEMGKQLKGLNCLYFFNTIKMLSKGHN